MAKYNEYTEAELQIVAFDAEDVITTSQETDEDGNIIV